MGCRRLHTDAAARPRQRPRGTTVPDPPSRLRPCFSEDAGGLPGRSPMHRSAGYHAEPLGPVRCLCCKCGVRLTWRLHSWPLRPSAFCTPWRLSPRLPFLMWCLPALPAERGSGSRPRVRTRTPRRRAGWAPLSCPSGLTASFYTFVTPGLCHTVLGSTTCGLSVHASNQLPCENTGLSKDFKDRVSRQAPAWGEGQESPQRPPAERRAGRGARCHSPEIMTQAETKSQTLNQRGQPGAPHSRSL